MRNLCEQCMHSSLAYWLWCQYSVISLTGHTKVIILSVTRVFIFILHHNIGYVQIAYNHIEKHGKHKIKWAENE